MNFFHISFDSFDFKFPLTKFQTNIGQTSLFYSFQGLFSRQPILFWRFGKNYKWQLPPWKKEKGIVSLISVPGTFFWNFWISSRTLLLEELFLDNFIVLELLSVPGTFSFLCMASSLICSRTFSSVLRKQFWKNRRSLGVCDNF